MTSPRLEEMSLRNRTPQEVIEARLARAQIERAASTALPRVMYTVLFRLPKQIRLLSPESDLMETPEHVWETINNMPRGWELARVIRHDDDTGMRDVTDEFMEIIEAERAAGARL